MAFFSDVAEYIEVNQDDILEGIGEHLYFALVPVALAFVISLPIGWLIVRFGWAKHAILTLSSIVYTIPSLALLVLLPGLLGTDLLDPTNVIIALTLYSVALLSRTTADGLQAVDARTVEAATAMGYRPLRRWLGVELPLAMPVVLAGLRVATVANVSMVSVAALIGMGGLGQLFTRGAQLGYYAPPIVIGLVLSVLIAVVADSLIVLIQRWLTPWTRLGGAR